MRTRKNKTGNKNIVGREIEKRRLSAGMKQKDLLAQLQIRGIDLTSSGLSKIEGQTRSVNDYELKALCEILGISPAEILHIGEEINRSDDY